MKCVDDTNGDGNCGRVLCPLCSPETFERPGKPWAKVIADSMSPQGVRLTTFQVRIWRPMLAEFNTHCVFSRNSASSRAIPLRKQIERIQQDPAGPLKWLGEQKGMQAGDEIEHTSALNAERVWGNATSDAIEHAEALAAQGVHKSIVNRLLEPFMWHTICVTATAYENFFNQRDHHNAQIDIHEAASLMRSCYERSVPEELEEGQWHLPYIQPTELGGTEIDYPDLVRISAARCARTSYMTQEGTRDPRADLALYDRLVTREEGNDDPRHWSPLEHVATPWPQNRQDDYHHGLVFDGLDGVNRHVHTEHLPRTGKLLGWRSLRTEVETELGERTYR